MNKHQKINRQLDQLSQLLDNSFTVPFTKYKIGIDPIIGLIPVLGDFVPVLLVCYYFFVCYELKCPKSIYIKILGIHILDFLLGCFPVLGDLIDAGFKSHLITYKILKKHIHIST